MSRDTIHVRGAREHNLKNIDVEIPRGEMVVFTGISGSGKSSLAFDTIFAEGQRRYVESLSSYARQFLGQMDKPDVDYIDGLSPAISIDQKSASHNPRSTVGTVTEIYDYMRLLFARIGHPHCPKCGREIERQTIEQIVDEIIGMPAGTRIMILGPVVRGRKGEYRHVFEDARRAGFIRARVDGVVRDLSEEIVPVKNKKHDIEIVVDRLVVPDVAGDAEALASDRSRISDSVETATRLGEGVAFVQVIDGEQRLFSEHFSCPVCGISLPEIEPRTFSFNNPHGACPDCTGLGTKKVLDPDLVIPNRMLSTADGAVHPWARSGTSSPYYMSLLTAVAEQYGFSVQTPVGELTDEQVDKILYGSGTETIAVRRNARRVMNVHFEGVVPNLERRYHDTDSEWMRGELEQYMMSVPCPTCNGARLRPETLAVTVGGRNIVAVTQNSIRAAARFFAAIVGEEALSPDEIALSEREALIARQIVKEIRARLQFLLDVGLEYLTLDRAAATLAGGEAQRIRLATQIGSGLMGVLYILDEPSIGLHQRDNERLIQTLEHLRTIGNTLIVVEHDEETMRAADHIIDIGPGAGEHGGHLVAQGTLEDIMRVPESITGQYLSGSRQIRVPSRRRAGNGHNATVYGATANNLKDIDVSFPLGKFVAVTGVSGSGKSTLVNEILHRSAAQTLNRSRKRAAAHTRVAGFEHLDKVIDIDQSPIGRTPRSNPATYTGAFTPIRELFASMPEAKIRGYKAGRFSFNVKGGRCEACRGEGIIQIEMHFLPDVYVPCEVCKGSRYNREALEIKFKGKSIAEVLDMTVDEALDLFENMPSIANKLRTLGQVGLGYIRVGQPSTTLSGGEAQRIKLATELSKRSTGKTLYILDEPTTGLHFADVDKLLLVLNRLVDAGNSVVVIEHNLDVIKTADWIIDLGPEGGDKGGTVVVEGTPEDVAACTTSHTGRFLASLLRREPVSLAG
jgi:excinuclease ABC subunit A